MSRIEHNYQKFDLREASELIDRKKADAKIEAEAFSSSTFAREKKIRKLINWLFNPYLFYALMHSIRSTLFAHIDTAVQDVRETAYTSIEDFNGLCSVCGTEDVPVQECKSCGYLFCEDCQDPTGTCEICADAG